MFHSLYQRLKSSWKVFWSLCEKGLTKYTMFTMENNMFKNVMKNNLTKTSIILYKIADSAIHIRNSERIK